MSRHCLTTLTALVLGSAATASAQPTPGSTSLRIPIVKPDLVAAFVRSPPIVEHFTDTNPCQSHSHTHYILVRIKGKFSASTPAPTATLYRDGQPIETWNLTVSSGSQEITLGSFSWTKDHPCPSGGTSISSVPPQPPPNYKLVVDPQGQQVEMSETNNSAAWYLNPSVPFVRAP